jgi:hypothetical protein
MTGKVGSSGSDRRLTNASAFDEALLMAQSSSRT